MFSLPKVPKQPDGLTLALEARYRGLVSGSMKRLVLWLPLHRTPSHNTLTRMNRWQKHELVREAQQAVLDARASLLPCSGSKR